MVRFSWRIANAAFATATAHRGGPGPDPVRRGERPWAEGSRGGSRGCGPACGRDSRAGTDRSVRSVSALHPSIGAVVGWKGPRSRRPAWSCHATVAHGRRPLPPARPSTVRETGSRRRCDVRESAMHGMESVKSLVVASLALAVLGMPEVVLADGRVALVVGNSTYDHIGKLPNPENDAIDMAAALRRLGFEVTTELDVGRVELTEALRAFTRRSAGADVSLVFYAGHGIEMDGVNYVVPVDARLERDINVRFETMTLDDLLVSTAGASLRLVVLDACRNNPLARSISARRRRAR
ncbi:MAG: caspase family protein [Acidobacteria bacterium]|nr:caspase family protein [Acidobacteriota bacterium]